MSPRSKKGIGILLRHLPIVGKYTALSLLAVLFFGIPHWMVLVNSFKPLGEAIKLGLNLPQNWTASENYYRVLVEGRYLQSFANSIITSGGSIIVLLCIGSLGAWAFGRSRSWWMRVLYYTTIVGVLLPPAIVPSIFLMRFIGIAGTRVALILFLIGTRLALVVFLTTGFVRTIPKEIEEVAEIDGAKKIRIFTAIILPLLQPVLFTVFVILTIIIWNDFFASFFLLQGENRTTLPLSLYRLTSGSMRQISWNLVFAHVMLVSMPLIVVYFFAQRKIVSGLTRGSIKG